ncbi:Nuclear transport factor 2 (NTF2) domain [Musa troglodytarum]|uniref:Nuclear transport factor 2 (NTF2) domain n=1 Tax=Musa troglodytarum TaxID=320322 RepID=A0A9E7GDU7_9LILI|nr:Nuclear transport factor 2 (NTF2) domain [Musa troglodytarum]
MDPDAVAKAFVEHYYRTFDGNRAALGGLYQDASMLTFEGDKIQGTAAIVAKLTSSPSSSAPTPSPPSTASRPALPAASSSSSADPYSSPANPTLSSSASLSFTTI